MPPKEEAEADKENDNYVRSSLLQQSVDIGVGAGDYSSAGEHFQRGESRTQSFFPSQSSYLGPIAERTRARGNQNATFEPEIPFDSVFGNKTAMDQELKEKEEFSLVRA